MMKRRRLTQSELSERRALALQRATCGTAWTNYPAIIQGFAERGLPVDDIRPRENVFTFQAWKALGRYVRKGEHGVQVLTWIESVKERENRDTGETETTACRYPRTTVVFHASQTEPMARAERI